MVRALALLLLSNLALAEVRKAEYCVTTRVHQHGYCPTEVWITQAEIDTLPTTGAVWSALYARATSSYAAPTGGNDDIADTNILATALVAATGDSAMLTKAQNALSAAIPLSVAGDTSLSASRNLTSYAIAADIIDYRDAGFISDVKEVVARDYESWGAGQDGNSVGEGSLYWKIWKVNNHGAMAMAAFAALSAYLYRVEPSVAQWRDNLDHVYEVLRYTMGEDPAVVPSTLGYTGKSTWNYGPNSENWQLLGGSAPTDYYVIYPQGAVDASGNSIDGLLPEAARRGSSTYVYPLPSTTYYYEYLQGLTVTLQIMDNAGYTVYPLGNYAHRRAIEYLYLNNIPISGDDEYQAPLIDYAYGINAIVEGGLWGGGSVDQGKNMGWTGWSHGLRITY